MEPVLLRAGEGEALFNGRIVIKADFEQLTITESHYPTARDGASPHFHRRHADSFYVLEGGLAVLVHDEEKLLEPGACVCAPPEVVHGFRSTSRAVFLNVHTPDGGFAENLRGRNRGEPENFDSVDAPRGSGRAPTDAVFRRPDEGDALRNDTRTATIKIARDELALVVFELEPGFEGPKPHVHRRHVDSFYVVEGEPRFRVGDETVRGEPGMYVAAPPGVVHSFSNGGPRRARLVNIHAPSCDFHDYLHVMEREDDLDEATHARYDVYEVE